MLDLDTIRRHRRNLTGAALYFMTGDAGPLPADALITKVAADIDTLLALADRLDAAITRLEDEAEQAAPGSAAYEALEEQLELLYQIAEAPPDDRP